MKTFLATCKRFKIHAVVEHTIDGSTYTVQGARRMVRGWLEPQPDLSDLPF